MMFVQQCEYCLKMVSQDGKFYVYFTIIIIKKHGGGSGSHSILSKPLEGTIP